MLFVPLPGVVSFATLVHLSIVGGMFYGFPLTPVNFPALRRLYVAAEYHAPSEVITLPIASVLELYPIAGQLHHLYIGGAQEYGYEELDTLLDKSKNLRSLSAPGYETLGKSYAGIPLLGIMVNGIHGVESLLKESFASKLIDSRTVVFLGGNLWDFHDEEEEALDDWAEGVGVRLEYVWGDVQEKWQKPPARLYPSEPSFFEFTDWIDREES